MRNCAASTRSSSTAITRRARRASREVRCPTARADFEHRALRDISHGVHHALAADSLARKCCPILGLIADGACGSTFVTLTLTLSGH